MCNEFSPSRRRFVKRAGVMSFLAAAAAAGCRRLVKEDNGGAAVVDSLSSGDTVNCVDRLWLSTSSLPNIEGKPWKPVDEQEVAMLLKKAQHAGVATIDCSPAYLNGSSQAIVGRALAASDGGFEVASRLPLDGEGLAFFKHTFLHTLGELGVDRLDYYAVAPSWRTTPEVAATAVVDSGLLSFLVDEKRAGRIAHLGFVAQGRPGVLDLLLKLHDDGEVEWDYALVQLNYYDVGNVSQPGRDAAQIMEQLRHRSIKVVADMPTLGGRLEKLSPSHTAMLQECDPAMSVADWGVRYALSTDGVGHLAYAPGTVDRLDEVTDLMAAFTPCTQAQMLLLEDIGAMMRDFPAVPCTDCKHCMPCPYGVDIPAVFTHYNKCLQDGDIALPHATGDEYRRARRDFLVGYDRSVPRLAQASRCINCGDCVPRCPQVIDIPGRLNGIDAYVDSLKDALQGF